MGRIEIVDGDITKEKVDVLVNNIGIGKGAGLLETPDAIWHEAFDGTLTDLYVPKRTTARK